MQQAAAGRLAALAESASVAQAAMLAARLETRLPRVPGVQLKKNEVAFLVLDGVGLVEPRRMPGRWVGGSQGISFRVAKGVHYRVGQTRGTYQQGEERPQIIDTGLGVITSQRICFVGMKQTREWSFAKLVGFSLDEDGMAIFNVSNRQKASGFAYQAQVDHIIDAVVAAAVAQFEGPDEHEAVVAELESMYREVHAAWAQLSGASAVALPAKTVAPWGPPAV